MAASNTGDNSKRKGRFVKGDPRINRKGRPKSFDALRELAQQIAHETAKVGSNDIIIDGHKVTVAEAILRGWAVSKNPQLQRAFIEVAFGKVPDEVKLDESGSIRVVIEYADGEASSPNSAHKPGGDTAQRQEV